ncbi:MAG: NnrU family protein [Alphaproteobacteria bacterium]
MVGTVSHVVYPALIFVAIHMASSTPLRASLVRALGERGYTGLFSLASAMSLGWMIWAYGAAPAESLWSTPGWSRLLIWVVMPFSTVLVVLGLTTPNPTMAMSESRLEAGDPAPGILKITRHPMMWGIVLWALSHIPANGDRASLVLFGTMAFTALVGMPLIDRKREESQGAAWGPFALTTSAIPFLAAIQGRTKIEWGNIRRPHVALGLVIFAALAFGHEWIIGVSALPG